MRVFGEGDLFGWWLDDECETENRVDAKDGGFWTPSSALFDSWKSFARNAGEDPGTETSFGKRLGERGFIGVRRKVEGKQVRGWVGIRLREDALGSDRPDPVAQFAKAPPVLQ